MKLVLEKGQQVTIADINTTAIEVYNKFNFLTPDELHEVSSGLFSIDTGENPPNFCGLISPTFCENTLIDIAIAKEKDEIKEILRRYEGE